MSFDRALKVLGKWKMEKELSPPPAKTMTLRLPDNELMHGDKLGLISVWAQRSTFQETILQILNKQQK